MDQDPWPGWIRALTAIGQTGLETGGSAFFPGEDLPELSLARITPELVRICFHHDRHPECPGEFH